MKEHIKKRLALAFLTASCAVIAIGASNMNREAWEYDVVFFSKSQKGISPLNDLGAEGWELVTSYNESGTHDGVTLIFKRRR